ncbi:MAG: GNAT family N-acetyltransferase [Nitriliruptorales bacterium]|nr:GNAT family N-acetyltransferase [Nitriliruptorales bacterium]
MEIRTITDAEVEPWVTAMNEGFLSHAEEGEAEFRRPAIDLDRTLAAFDGDKVVGTYRSWATELTLPGGDTLPAAAVTNVTVTPTHRRRRLLTEMITRDLRESQQRGEALSVLIASEYPIYGRYGYGPATEHVKLEVKRHAATFRRPPSGTVELLTPDEVRPHMRAVYDAHRRANPGEIDRRDRRLDREAGIIEMPGKDKPHPYQAICRDRDGNVTGYVRYRVNNEWEGRVSDVRIEVRELWAPTPEAQALLWSFCLGMDWVVGVTGLDRGPDDLLPSLLEDARAVRQSERADFLWTRILDVPTALGARSYLHDTSFVLEVHDPLGFTEGRYRVTIDGGVANCEPTDDEPDVAVGVAVLSSVLLGGWSLLWYAEAGLVDAPDRTVLTEVDTAFRWHRRPWCATWF